MLNSKLKLNANEIAGIARKGKRFQGELFDVKVWWDNNLENPEFAISISKKIDARAVIRNRIKRKLRAAISDLSKEKVRKGKFLIVVRSVKLSVTSVEDIKALLSKIILMG